MARRDDDLKARLLATFRVEAEEHIQTVTGHLLALGRGLPEADARAAIEESFRAMHTLKGAARSVGFLEAETLSQACEGILSRLSRGHLEPAPPILTLLHEALTQFTHLLAGRQPSLQFSELLERLARVGAESAPQAERPAPASPRREAAPKAPAGTVAGGRPPAGLLRLDPAQLDALLLQAEDLLLPKLAATERVQEARALAETAARCRAAVTRAGAAPQWARCLAPAAAPAEDPMSVLQALEAQATAFAERLTHDQRTIVAAVDGLQERLRRLRMTPAAAVLDLFPGMVRNLADTLGKQVAWVVHGADLEVDRKVLEAMKDPLIHLVRNAIDHGIEPPEARQRAGKPPQGRITATVTALEGNRIEFRVEDDGRGIDLAQVRAAAVRGRYLTEEEAQALSEEAALELVFRSGLSTTPLISQVSGHGLGLAIVRERVERLDGHLRVETRPGVGTAVRITLPVTVASFRGLLVRAGGQPFLLPLEAVERTVRLRPEETKRAEGRPMILWDGQPVPAAPLRELLELPESSERASPNGPTPCAILRAGEDRFGLAVEDILGEQEVLVKELGAPLVRVRHVAGAGLLGTGRVVLILRPRDLLASLRARPRAAIPPRPSAERPRQPVILVVDDSITTRTMERHLLEAAGYRVQVAVDGVEAWARLTSEPVDLVVSDVDMPRMNGFELTEKIRAHRELAQLPVILVTALESREDKERGLRVGANAYIVKSSFDQSNLLEFIRRLL
ncbi:hybrid sensor histidine kinase/response regulator [Nitrospira sp. Kam-Ns4a]